MHRTHILAALVLSSMVALSLGVHGADDTPKAAETRKKLKLKIDVEFRSTRIDDALDEIKEKVPGLKIRFERAAGISFNTPVSFKGTKQTVSDVLDGLFKKTNFGYIVISKQGDAYDGLLLVKLGKERGRPLGDADETAEEKKGDKESGEAKTTTKAGGKEKGTNKEKTAAKPKPMPKEPAEEDPDKAEQNAAQKFKFAKTLADDGKTEKAKERLHAILKDFPTSKAATQAKELLKKLEEKEEKD